MKSKKAQQFLPTVIAYITFGIIIAFVLFVSNGFVTELDGKYQTLVPDVSYNFPSVVLNGFLMTELKDEDKEKFFSSKDGDYRVKDIIWFDTDESKSVFEEYRSEYIAKLKKADVDNDLFENFRKFSGSNVNEDEIIILEKTNALTPLSFQITSKNYFYSFRTQNEETIIVKFSKDQLESTPVVPRAVT